MSGVKYLNDDDYFEGTASADLASGDVVFDAMERAGIITAQSGVTSGAQYKAQAKGRFEFPAKAADDWAAGDLVYWDSGNAELTDTVGSNKVVGRADAAKAAAATTATVLLNSAGKSFVDTDT